jgi:thiamine-monophosphate kinase
MNLHQIGEFGLIRRIQKKFPSPVSSVPLGIGDDAAAILPSPQKYLLLTTDSLLEQTHFDLSFSNFLQIGYKAVAVNISDIAAMGGTPRFFMVSLGLTERQTVHEVDQLYRGIRKGSREAGIYLIGGNTTSSKGAFFISLTVLGEVSKNEMVTRRGAKVGDSLYVTGTLGDAAAGLELLQKGYNTKSFRRLVQRYQIPQARWKEGRLLAGHAIPSAMIDLSDGLTSDMGHLAEESGVGIELDLSRIPVSAPLKQYSLQIGGDPLKYALHGGEDYELLFSVPEKKIGKLQKLLQKGLIRAERIGIITGRKRGLVARSESGEVQRIYPGGYNHFKRGRGDVEGGPPG